ncbi:MAG: hypothetical protein C0485_15155 [Pirellula sp.]|nr:hypothetical protein [Pirellula sp.]
MLRTMTTQSSGIAHLLKVFDAYFRSEVGSYRAYGAASAVACAILLSANLLSAEESGLVGHWKLQGDCRDYSGQNNHGVNHGVDLSSSAFDGTGAYIEVPHSDSLNFATGDFSILANVYTEEVLDDIVGDVIDKFDPTQRRGVTLSVNSSAGGYQGPGDDRHVCFGIDNGRTSEWIDCGRPNPTSNYVSNSLTVFDGKLYAATADAADKSGWRHVYCYDGDQKWTDCGQVGDGKSTGVGALIVHQGELYAATSTYDWTRVSDGDYEPGRVYRYCGGTKWEDCGQPSDDRTLNSLASFGGKLFVGGGPSTWGVFTPDGSQSWKPAKLFSQEGPERCFPHAMGRFNGKLYVGFPGVHAFDGKNWTFVGLPSATSDTLQTHSLTAYRGQLCAGTWPEGKVTRFDGGDSWTELGRVGEDGTEVNALVTYNGKLYGGSIPRAEVCRYDEQPAWTSLKRFYSPEGWQPVPPSQVGGKPTRAEVNEWSRVTSLTVFNGQLFASTGSCTSSILDAPADVRGKVFSMEAGKCASYDHDLGPGWKHLAAVRKQGVLTLYVDGRPVATSFSFEPGDYDLSNDRPLRIGFGESDYFCGKINDVRAYRRALGEDEILAISSDQSR